jgi:hypothetical protein
MPISQRPIQNCLDSSNKNIFLSSAGNDVIGDKTFSSILGTLKQLSDLAKHSNDIFSQIINISDELDCRFNSLALRVSNISKNNEKNNEQDASSQVNIFRETETITSNLKIQSLTINKIPNFTELQNLSKYFVNEGKDMFKLRYSNPNFFLNEWCEMQQKNMIRIVEKNKEYQNNRKLKLLQQQQQQEVEKIENEKSSDKNSNNEKTSENLGNNIDAINDKYLH